MLSGSAVVESTHNRYEVDEDALLYDKNLKKGDKDYKLFSLRTNSVLNFHSVINFDEGKP